MPMTARDVEMIPITTHPTEQEIADAASACEILTELENGTLYLSQIRYLQSFDQSSLTRESSMVVTGRDARGKTRSVEFISPPPHLVKSFFDFARR